MVCHSFMPLVLLATGFFLLQAQSSPLVFQKRGICATEDPDASFLSALQQVKVDEAHPSLAVSQARQAPIEIETWFHIVSSHAEVGQVTDYMINSQVCPLLISRRPLMLTFYSSRSYRMHMRMLLFSIACRVSPTTSMMSGHRTGMTWP